jgi:ABC-type branched-subunit amino acid transport system substrate-binding protein
MKRFRSAVLPALLVAALALLPSACGRGGSGGAHRIGVAVALSGKNQSDGEAMLRALELYASDLNAAGGINGTPIELVVKDDQNNKTVAPAIAKELVNDSSILAVIGHQFSSTSLSVTELYDQAGVVHVTPSATNPRVTRSSPWVFSMNFEDDTGGESLAVHLAVAEGAKSVVLVHSDDAYPMGLVTSFGGKAERLGITIERDVTFSAEGDVPADLLAAADIQADAKQADAIMIFANTADGAVLVKQLRKLGIDTPVFGADSFLKASFITALDGDTADVHATGGFLYEMGTEESRKFVAKHREEYDARPSILGAYCYDALDLLRRAIGEKGADRQAIRDYLAKIDNADDAVRGASGLLYFDENGATQRQIVVSMIQGDGFLPTYRQVKRATDPRVLRVLPERIAAGDVVIADGEPYHVTTVVHTGIDFFRVNDVDVAGMNFDVEFFVWFRWVGGVEVVEGIDFLNGIFGINDKDWDLREDLTGPVKYRAKKYKGTYLTPYDVSKFPFDYQYLPIVVSHTKSDANQVMLVMDSQGLNHAPIEEIYPQEWDYIEREDDSGTYREDSTFGDPDLRGGPKYVEFSAYRTRVVIKRIMLPYLVTLFTPLAIMVLVCTFVYFIPADQFDARMTLVMTALLAIIVFHLAAEGSLPNVGYLIRADMYFLVGYMLAFVLIIQTIWANRAVRREKIAVARRTDLVSGFVLIPAAVVAYVWLTVTAI